MEQALTHFAIKKLFDYITGFDEVNTEADMMVVIVTPEARDL